MLRSICPLAKLARATQIGRRIAILAVLAAGVGFCGRCIAADSTFNITYLGEASNPFVNGLAPDPGCTGGCWYGDVWAEGGYAYVGTDVDNGGMNVFSLANPANPVFLTRYAGDQFEDVEVWDGVGYFSSDTNTTSGTGVDIVDLSIPFDPEMLSRVNSADGGHNKVHTLSVYNNYLYTVDNNVSSYSSTDFVKIFNVADPANPQLVTNLQLTTPNNDAIAAHEVIVRDNRMYVASKNNGHNSDFGWVHIYDVANPAAPKLLKRFTTYTQNGQTKSMARSHTAQPSGDGKLLIVAEERVAGNLYIFDISNINQENDPDAPIWRATLNSASLGLDASTPHHPHLHGNLMFVPWYESGLQVFNISDPANPVRVGSFDTYSGPSTNSVNPPGDWGVDLSLGLKRVLISDRNRGLIVVDASGVVAPGDYDQNMSVAAADYDAWRLGFGNSTSGLHVAAFADGNYNNVVDAADYVLWRKHLGETGPTHPGAGDGAAVPEPTSILLFIVACGFLSVGRQRFSERGPA